MKMFEFPDDQTCPRCGGVFRAAPREEAYEPVVVVSCPHCSTMLWRPGLDEHSPLFTFDPDADAGGI